MINIFCLHFVLIQNEAKNQENMMLLPAWPELARHVFWPTHISK
jgi:hypothetical protein